MEALLIAPEGKHYSSLDRLRRPPTRISGPALVNAYAVRALRSPSAERLEEIRALDVGAFSLAGIPPSRHAEGFGFPITPRKALARHAAAARAQAIARMPEERRVATLFAFAQAFELRAMDDARRGRFCAVVNYRFARRLAYPPPAPPKRGVVRWSYGAQ